MCVLAYFAGLYGYYWHTQANPQINSTVWLDGQYKFTGSVSRTWQGDYKIVEEDGNVVIVNANSISGAMYPVEGNERKKAWRMLLPPMMVLILFLVKDAPALVRLFKQGSPPRSRPNFS